MDLRRVRIEDWAMGAFGLVLAVSPFLAWYSLCSAPSDAPGECSPALTLTGWDSFAVAGLVMLVAGLVAIAAVGLTAAQRTPAAALALTSIGALVALVALGLAVAALFRDSGGQVGASDAALLPGAWIGAGAAAGLFVSMLASIRDERIPAEEGSPPEVRTLALSSNSPEGGVSSPPATPPERS